MRRDTILLPTGLGLIVATLLMTGCSPAAPPADDPRAVPFVEAMFAAMRRGDLNGALALSDSAARYAPRNAELAVARGDLYSALRRYDAAKEAYEAAVAADSRFPGAWYQLGQNAFLQRRYREALGYYRKEQDVLGAGADPASAAAIEAQIGRTYAMLGVPDSARVSYTTALASDSTQASAHAWLSELLESEGRLPEALHHARLALQANPRELENGYRVGALLFQTGKPQEALPYLNVVAQRLPGHEGAAFNLGRALQALGREGEAKVYLDRVEQIQALQQQAVVAERAVETYPGEPQRWIDLAGLMMQMGYFDRAETALNAAQALRPRDLSLQSDLANLAFTRGDTTAALQRFQTLLRMDSTYADGWLNLGIVYAVSGDVASARKAWETALRHKPGDPDATAYLNQLKSGQ
ncbi:MAG: tetratricopeptide repeat protein [Rhodothermales bacterium]